MVDEKLKKNYLKLEVISHESWNDNRKGYETANDIG